MGQEADECVNMNIGIFNYRAKKREFKRRSLCHRRELPQCVGSRDSSEMLLVAAYRSDSDIPAMDSHLLMTPSK